MKDFSKGFTYLRKEARLYVLVADSDSDGVVVERLIRIIRGEDPFDDSKEGRAAKEAATVTAMRAHEEKGNLVEGDVGGKQDEAQEPEQEVIPAKPARSLFK